MIDIRRLMNDIMMHNKTPLALTLVSCSGVIAVGILSAKAAPKAVMLLDRVREDKIDNGEEPNLTFGEVVKNTWKIYSPPVAVGAITIASIVSMNRLSEKHAMVLTAGATLATNTLKEYQQHVLDEIGVDRELKVRDRIAKHTLKKAVIPEGDSDVYLLGDGELLCYDALSGRYFKSSVEEIRKIENELNREILTEMYVPLNSLYYYFDLEPIEVGTTLGFNIDNMVNMHFSAQLAPNNKPVLVVSHINSPVPYYDSVRH